MTTSSPAPRSDTRPADTFDVQLAGTGLRFQVAPGERILAAARRAGVWLPFECGWGSCGTCKITLLEGDTKLLFPDAPAVDPRDSRRRRTITCQTTALSHLTIKALRTGWCEERRTRDHWAELLTADDLGPDIRRFRFRLDTVSAYRPGQYAILELAPGLRRCYSMAGPAGTRHVEFIAKHYPGRPGSSALFALRSQDVIPAELPYGDMWLRPGDRDIALIAGGTGIAPMLALLRQLADASDPRAVHLFYGANTEEELACWQEIRDILRLLPAGRLHGALLTPGPAWPGTRGLVTDALTGPLPELAGADHYLAGPPVMVDAVLALLRQAGIPADHIHYDRFG